MLALLCVFVGNPLLVSLVGLLPKTVGNVVLVSILCLLGADLFGSVAAIFQLNGSLKEPSQISRRWARLTRALDNAVTRAIQRRICLLYTSRCV